MDQANPWHVSALQAPGLESILLPTRLKTSDDWDTASLDHLEILLNGENDHRIAQLSFGVGETITSLNHINGSSHSREESRREHPAESTCQLFPGHETPDRSRRNPHYFAATEVRRGLHAEEADMFSDGEGEDVTDGLRFLK